MSLKIKKNLPSLRLKVFDVMCLIKYHVIPLLSAKDRVVSYCYFITGNAYVETIQFGPSFSLDFAFFSRTEISHDFEGRAPSFELDLPVH